MKRKWLVISLIFFGFGCTRDKDETIVSDKVTLDPYIKTLILPDAKKPSERINYIHVNFKRSGTSETKELTFSQEKQNMSVWSKRTYAGLGMFIQGVHFRDQNTNESLEISFYSRKTDTTFNICYADYFFADPWNNFAGANIFYQKPVNDTDPNTYNLYLGTNSNAYFFKITYIGNNRLNGIFHTQWKECCGDKITYDVFGDFSIPDIRYFDK